MKNAPQPSNRIKELREAQGMSSRELAKRIGLSAPQMGRLENGKSQLNVKWILKISAALKVDTSEVVNLPISKKFRSTCDDTLLGSAIGWLLEASEEYKIELSRQELSKFASYVYKEAVEQPLNFNETRYLAFTIVRVLKMSREKEKNS